MTKAQIKKDLMGLTEYTVSFRLPETPRETFLDREVKLLKKEDVIQYIHDRMKAQRCWP